MEDVNFENIKKKSVVPEIKRMLELADKLHLDVKKAVKELNNANTMALQVSSSKIIDEFLVKAKRELDRVITDYVLKRYYDLENNIKESNVSNRRIDINMHSAFSAIGIKHYELAIETIEQINAEMTELKKPKIQRLQATEIIKCDICNGKIKPGMFIIICTCGKKFHEPCAMRTGTCTCGVKLK